jgi:hypothetical protein
MKSLIGPLNGNSSWKVSNHLHLTDRERPIGCTYV